ncbi:MAG: ABC transporter permease, partial [Clostridium sp.]
MSKLKSLCKYIYAVTMIFIFWYLLYFLLDSFVIPNPIDVVKRLFVIGVPVLSKHIFASTYR